MKKEKRKVLYTNIDILIEKLSPNYAYYIENELIRLQNFGIKKLELQRRNNYEKTRV